MSFVVSAIVAVGVGTVAYSSDRQRKATNQGRDALSASQAADARNTAAAETGALAAANAKTADAKRRRRSSSLLASGGGVAATDTLGGTPSVLSGGGKV